jgi:hypothetical protein
VLEHTAEDLAALRTEKTKLVVVVSEILPVAVRLDVESVGSHVCLPVEVSQAEMSGQ